MQRGTPFTPTDYYPELIPCAVNPSRIVLSALQSTDDYNIDEADSIESVTEVFTLPHMFRADPRGIVRTPYGLRTNC